MASNPAKSKKPRNKPSRSRPAATSAIAQPAIEDASSSHNLSSFSSRGDLFAFVSLSVDKHRLRVFDTVTGQSIAEHIVESGRVSSLAWAHADTWSHTESGPKRKRKRRNQQGDSAGAESLSSGVILGLSNGSIVLFSPSHGKAVKSLSDTTSTATITSVAVDGADSDSVHLWTTGADGTVRLWDLQQGIQVSQWKSDERIAYSAIAVRPSVEGETDEGEQILVAHHAIQLLSTSHSPTSTASKTHKIASFTGHASSVNRLLWCTRSTFISAAEGDRIIYVWDVPTLAEGESPQGRVAASIPLDSEVRRISLSEDSSSGPIQHTLVTLSASSKVSVFPLSSELSQLGSSKSKSKVITLEPKTTVAACLKDRQAQVLAAASIKGDHGKIRVARLAGGAKVYFDLVDYLDASGEYLEEVALPPLPAGIMTANEAETTKGVTTQRYIESQSVAIRSGTEVGQSATMDESASRNVEGELDAGLAELSLGQRLTALTGTAEATGGLRADEDDLKSGDKTTGSSLQTVPASSLTRTLIQALHSSDSGLLETCLAHTNSSLIQNTVSRLPSQLAVPLVVACVERLGRGKRVGRGKGGGAGAGAQRGTGLVRWIRAVLLVHGGHLLTIPDLVARLSGLHATLTSRLALQQSMLSLNGRLDMVISQIEMRSTAAPAPLPGPQSVKSKGKQKKQEQKQATRYVEGESEDEEEQETMEVEVESGDDAGSIEDVELGGSDEDDDEEDSDEDDEDEGEVDDAEDEGEDEDEDDSDGDLRLNGFVDDEAEEYSEDDEDEDESE